MKRNFFRIISMFMVFLTLFNSIDLNVLANSADTIPEQIDYHFAKCNLNGSEIFNNEEIDFDELGDKTADSEVTEDDKSDTEIETNVETDESETDVLDESEAVANGEKSNIGTETDDSVTESTDDWSVGGSEVSTTENDSSISENTISVSENSISENEIEIKNATYVYDGFTVVVIVTDSWDMGYNISVDVINTSDSIIENWMVTFKYSNTISNIWNAHIENNEGGKYVIKNDGWNQDIAPGEKISFGFTSDNVFEDFPTEYELVGENNILDEEDYTIWYELTNDWGSGFQGNIYIRNNMDVTIEDWSLSFDFERKITNIWGANITIGEGYHYELHNAGYNSNIEPNQVISIGFLGTEGLRDYEPYNYELYSYVFDEIEYVQLADGRIEKAYLENAIYPELILRGISINDVRLSDDFDGDNLTLADEYEYDTNPFIYDTDEDGLSDYEEIFNVGTSPIMYDTDSDGMSDGTEVNCGLNPLVSDTNGDGVNDGDETTTQDVRIFSLFDYDIAQEGTVPALIVTGKGDYSQKIYVKKEDNNEAIYGISSVKGTAYDFVHDDTLVFDNAEITYVISSDILSKYELDDLVIAYFDKETNELQLIDTTYDLGAGTISANVSHLSTYCVVSASEFFGEIDINNFSAHMEKGKADIVFAIDTTGSMGYPISNVRNNITTFTEQLEVNDVDTRLGLVEYKDIYADGIDSTKNYGWFSDVSSFKTKLASLSIYGGGDGPESTVDAIYSASRMTYRSGVDKYIIVITDANNKNGINGNPDISLSNVLIPYSNDYVSVSVVTNPYYYNDYAEIVADTDGVLADITGDFAYVLDMLISKISVDVNDKYWIRLANGTVVALDADPSLGDVTVDTDGDGLADVYELNEIIIKQDYNPQNNTYETYEAWTFTSNPAKIDTDGDTVIDTIDLYPTNYNAVVISEDSENVVFNSGRTWNKLKYDAETFIIDSINEENASVGANSAISALYPEAKIAVKSNSNKTFSMEELCYIGIDNNSGSKLYLQEKTSALREKVFQEITGRKSKWYKHKGSLFTDSWEEVAEGTTGGFWKGLVLTEADLNFSCRQYLEEDATAYYTIFTQLGAVIIGVVAATLAPEAVLPEVAVGVLAGNAGVATSEALGYILLGSVTVYYACGSLMYVWAKNAPNNYYLTEDDVSSLAWVKVDSLSIDDAMEKAQVYAIVYAMMAAKWLDIDIAIPSPTNPTASLTDEEIYARLDELNKDIALDLSSSLTSDERDTVLMIVCGYNKATNQFGVGIKIDIEAIDEKPDKYIDLDTKLRNGVPSWANVMIGDTMYDGYEFNHGYDYVYNDFSDIYYPCAEDFCVIVLGGLDNESYLKNSDIIMGQPFRLRSPVNGGGFNAKPVCEKCECRYARSSFVPGVLFKSTSVLRAKY